MSQPALATGSNTTKYTAGVVTSRSALADVKGGSTTVRTTPATAKYKNGTLTVTARGDSAAECYAYVVSYDSKDKSKAPLDIAFAKIVVHLAPSSLALNTDKSNVSVNTPRRTPLRTGRPTLSHRRASAARIRDFSW